MSNTSPLQPLADALLAARHDDGIWPEPLDWLAEQVLRPCTDLPRYPPHGAECKGCQGANWLPFDPEALHWSAGWATGLGLKWLKRHLTAFRPRACRYQKWYDVLGDALSDSVYQAGESATIEALVEAVKAIAEVPHA